jgi:predicted Zn-ribbon and HTH transcriptional regulator
MKLKDMLIELADIDDNKSGIDHSRKDPYVCRKCGFVKTREAFTYKGGYRCPKCKSTEVNYKGK